MPRRLRRRCSKRLSPLYDVRGGSTGEDRCAAGVDDRAGVQAEIRAIGAGDYLHAKRGVANKAGGDRQRPRMIQSFRLAGVGRRS